MPTEPLPTPTGTLSELLRTLAAERPQAEALAYPGFAFGGRELRLSFAQLDARVDALARGLMAWGVQARDAVALWSVNVPDWIPLEYALARVGAVLVTVNTALSADEVAYVLRQSGARWVLHPTRNGSNECSSTLDELLSRPDVPLPRLAGRAWLPAAPHERPPEGVLTTGVEAAAGTSPARPRGRLPSLEELVDRGGQISAQLLASREAGCLPGDVVNVQYTSGTTGLPKGVMLSHVNLLSTAVALGHQLTLRPDDRTVLMVPLFHCFGCVVVVLASHVRRAAICAIQAFEPADALRLIEDERCTVLFGVPTMFAAMLADPALKQRNTRTLRTGFAAGAPCPEALMHDIITQLHCAGMSVAYGLTEAAPGVSGSRPDDSVEVRCQTIGKPLRGVDVRLVDLDTHKDVPEGQTGELWARGPNVMLGYHDDARATASAIVEGGWLRTGDLARRREDRNLVIVGRAKEIIIRGGENIAPAEVESALRSHPDILDAAVVGVPHERYGEEVACAVVLRQGATLNPAAYEAHLTGHLAPFKQPAHWRAVERFPLTGSGKVQRYKLAQQMAAQLGRADQDQGDDA